MNNLENPNRLFDFVNPNNSLALTLQNVKDEHIIPVHTRSNEPTISQAAFIEMVMEQGSKAFDGVVGDPAIKVSHAVKGRTYEARHKAKSELLPEDQTLYYERMAFAIELPEYTSKVGDRELTLTLVGIKAYNEDNLNANRQVTEHFKFGIGFNVDVCTNMCFFGADVSTNMQVTSLDALRGDISAMMERYSVDNNLSRLREFSNYGLSEEQFAKFLGRCRLYHAMPKPFRKEIAPIHLNESQISAVGKGYYDDVNFAGANKELNMWNFYNLLTGSAKSTYIDQFMGRNVNALDITEGVIKGLKGEGNYNWYLN